MQATVRGMGKGVVVGKGAFFLQAVKQAGGLMVMAVRYNGKEPDKGTGASLIEYALPFEGAWTVLNGGVDKDTSHSWSVLTQRYAYDFVVLDDEGRSCRPDADPADPASYHCYGLPILAPADGVVAEVGTSCPNAPIMLDDMVHFGGDDIRGNYVLIDHGNGEFSCLCHLKPGGVLVEAGQRVSCGHRVGLCGSSGCSSEPHLHFHVQKGQSFYTSPGVPVRFAGATAVPAPCYEAADPRPVPPGAYDDFPPFLTRGLKVERDA